VGCGNRGGIELASSKSVANSIRFLMVAVVLFSSAKVWADKTSLAPAPTAEFNAPRANSDAKMSRCYIGLLSVSNAQRSLDDYMSERGKTRDLIVETRAKKAELSLKLRQTPYAYKGLNGHGIAAIEFYDVDRDMELKERVEVISRLWIAVKPSADFNFLPKQLQAAGVMPFDEIFRQTAALPLSELARLTNLISSHQSQLYSAVGSKLTPEFMAHYFRNHASDTGHDYYLLSSLARVRKDAEKLKALDVARQAISTETYADVSRSETKKRFAEESFKYSLQHDTIADHLARLLYQTVQLNNHSPAVWMRDTVNGPLEKRLAAMNALLEQLNADQLPTIDPTIMILPRISENSMTGKTLYDPDFWAHRDVFEKHFLHYDDPHRFIPDHH
jgi:hypothetical protein